MSEVSIKVNIGSRTYPLSIKQQEEEIVRNAAKNVNESIKVLQDNYAVKDMQDLLAMTALQVSTQLIVKKEEKPKEDPRLAELDRKITDYLNKQ